MLFLFKSKQQWNKGMDFGGNTDITMPTTNSNDDIKKSSIISTILTTSALV